VHEFGNGDAFGAIREDPPVGNGKDFSKNGVFDLRGPLLERISLQSRESLLQ
jgi:hypothetical protein